MNNGIHSLSGEQYFAADGLSRSMLDTLITESPLHFYAAHISKTEAKEETDAMRLGSLTHRCILEPDTMAGAFHVRPAGMKFTTKDGMAWRDEHSDRPILTACEAGAVTGMRDAVWAHKAARRFLQGARTEQCLFALDGKGTLRKARVDIIPSGGNAMPDLKTCASADYDEMTKAVERLGYYRQAAFTLALCKFLQLEFEHWMLICVESASPHDVVVYPIDELAIRVGHNEVEGAIQTYRNCLETGKWPGRCDGIADALTLPAWRQREMDQA